VKQEEEDDEVPVLVWRAPKRVATRVRPGQFVEVLDDRRGQRPDLLPPPSAPRLEAIAHRREPVEALEQPSPARTGRGVVDEVIEAGPNEPRRDRPHGRL
jgi:hypothetical protein